MPTFTEAEYFPGQGWFAWPGNGFAYRHVNFNSARSRTNSFTTRGPWRASGFSFTAGDQYVPVGSSSSGGWAFGVVISNDGRTVTNGSGTTRYFFFRAMRAAGAGQPAGNSSINVGGWSNAEATEGDLFAFGETDPPTYGTRPVLVTLEPGEAVTAAPLVTITETMVSTSAGYVGAYWVHEGWYEANPPQQAQPQAVTVPHLDSVAQLFAPTVERGLLWTPRNISGRVGGEATLYDGADR